MTLQDAKDAFKLTDMDKYQIDEIYRNHTKFTGHYMNTRLYAKAVNMAFSEAAGLPYLTYFKNDNTVSAVANLMSLS